MSSQNMEEAAAIAMEYITSLDHLPGEVQHLLHEIRAKESRSQELQQEITRDCNKFTRHALRHPSTSMPSTPATPSAPSPVPSPAGTNGKNGSTPISNAPPKDQALLPKIDANYAEIDRLALEKIALAERLVALLRRTRSRLDVELAKVSLLQGDVGVGTGVSGLASRLPLIGAGKRLDQHGVSPGSKINEILTLSLSPAVGGGDSSVTGPSAMKRRKLGAHASLKQHGTPQYPLPIPTPPSLAASSTPYSRSRPSQQAHPRPGRRAAAAAAAAVQEEEDIDMDAEGEDDDEADADGEEDAEDKGLYCFCQQMSHGEMIACDNPGCRYEWFHIDCVNVKPPLPDRYFCSDCESKGFGITAEADTSTTSSTPGATGRKGRGRK